MTGLSFGFFEADAFLEEDSGALATFFDAT
jgi:hypothetical protein